jgi:hypothetical integral membrane protein (TIGR02206 family)
MENLFAAHYQGEPFRLFDTAHLLALLSVLAISLAIVWYGQRKPTEKERVWLRNGLAIFSLANQIVWQLWQWWAGVWDVAYALPLHLCTLSGFLCAWMLFKRSQRLYAFLYFWCLAGSGNGLFTPDLLIYGFPHFRFWIFFTAHGAVVLAVVYMTAVEGMRPTWRTLGQAIVVTNLYLLVALTANYVTGGNYMYISRPPEFASFIDLLGPWPWYIVWLEVLGIAMFVLVYLPFALHDWFARRRPAEPPQIQFLSGKR